MALIWLRLDVDCGSTGWTGDLPLDQFGAWIKLLLAVKVGGERGTIPKSKFTDGMLKRSGIKQGTWKAMLAAGLADGAIAISDGDITITNWKKYQQDPTNADRQRRHKQKQREAGVTGVTLSPLGNAGNDDGTGLDGTGRDGNKSKSVFATDDLKAAAKRQAAELAASGDNLLVHELGKLLGNGQANHACWCKLAKVFLAGCNDAQREQWTRNLLDVANAAVKDDSRNPAAAFMSRVQEKWPGPYVKWGPKKCAQNPESESEAC